MDAPRGLSPNWRTADFSLAMPEFAANPGYFYKRLQAESPVHRIASTDIWILTQYQACLEALTDERFRVGGRSSPQQLPPGYEQLPRRHRRMLSSDPPDHTPLRSLVNQAFTPRAVERLWEQIARVAHELLDPVRPWGEMDLVAEFAFPLPAIVITELLGVPRADREQFKAWSNALIQSMGADATPERRKAGMDAQLALAAYFDRILAQRRHDPGDDLITRLIQAEEHGDQLDHDELVSAYVQLLIAGHETTTNLIAGGMLALVEHPDQFTLLRRRPELTPAAVEELLRFTSPVQRMSRWTSQPVEIGGQAIPENQTVVVVMAAANRDPAVFPNPDRLDITRSPNPHLAFGRGIHYCLGAPLARMEAAIAFSVLPARLPGLRLADRPPVWNPATLIRGLKSLPVVWR